MIKLNSENFIWKRWSHFGDKVENHSEYVHAGRMIPNWNTQSEKLSVLNNALDSSFGASKLVYFYITTFSEMFLKMLYTFESCCWLLTIYFKSDNQTICMVLNLLIIKKTKEIIFSILGNSQK